MPPAKAKRAAPTPRRPELKFGPFHGGTAVAIWCNEVRTENGSKYFRSVTIAPRRYRDPKTGEWKNAGSFNATDLPALILALQAAHQFMSSTPLPGQQAEEEQVEVATASENGDGSIPY